MKTFKRKLVDNSMDLFIEVDGQYVANDNLFKRVIPAMVKPEVLQASQRKQEQNIQTNTQNKDEKTLIKELSVSISKAYKDLDKNKQDRLEIYENNGYKIEVGSKPPLSYVAFYDSDLSNDNSTAMYLYASTNTSSVLLASQIEARLNQVVQGKILDNRNAFYVDRENILSENNYVSSEITPQKDDLAIFANLALKKELDKRVVAQEYPKEHLTEQNLKNSQMVDEIKSQGEIKGAGNSRILSDKELIESMKATSMEQWSKEQKELFDDMPKFKQDQILDAPKIKYDEEVFGKIPYNELSFRNQIKVIDEAKNSAKGKELQAQYDKLEGAKYTAGEDGKYPSGAQLEKITKAQNKIAAQRDELINTYIKEYNEKVAGNSRIPSDKADDDSVEKIKAEIETAPAHNNYKGGEAPNTKSEIHMVEKFFVEKVDDEFVTQKRFVNEQENNALKDQFEAEIAKVILEVEPAWRENMLNVPLSLKANQETYLSNILKESDVDYATALAQDDKNTIYTVAEQKIVEKILKERQEHRIEIFQDDYALTDKTTGNAINKNSNLASIMLDKTLPHGLGNHPADELSTFWFNHCSSWQRDRVSIDDIDIQKATKLTYKKEKLTLDECAELSKFLAKNAIEFSDNKPREVADGARKFVPSNALYKVAEGLNDQIKEIESRELKKFLVKHMSSTFTHTDEVPNFLVERNGSAIFTRINRDYLSEINGKFNEVDEVRLKHISNYLSDRKEAGLANHRAEFETAFFVCDNQFKEAFHRAGLALAEKLDGQGAVTEIASYLETNEFVAYRADHIKELLRVEERATQEFIENYKEPLDLDEANKRIDNLLDNEIPKASEQFYYKMDLLLDNPNFRFADMKEACELEVKRKELELTYNALTDYIHTKDKENNEKVSNKIDEAIAAKPDENTEPKQEPLKNQGIVANEENYQTLMKLYNGEATDAKELDNLIEWVSENKEILEAKSAANYAIKFGTGQILKSVDAGFVLEIVEPLIMEKQENKKSWEELEKEAVEVTKKEAWVKKQLDDLPIRLQAGYSPQLIAESLNDAYQRGDIVPPEWLHEVVRELDKNYGGVAVFIDENLKKEAIGKEKVSESNEQKEIAQAGENKAEVGLFDDEIVSKIVENKTNDRGNKTKTQASENIPEALDSKVAGYGYISAQKLAVSDYRSNNFDLDGVGAARRAYKNIEALELSAKLNRENRFATKEEQEILARFSGWGGCYGVFEETNKDFGEARKRLDKYLDENISNSVDRNLAFISMAHSSSSAYYTNTLLVDTIYKGLEQMGVNDNGVEKRVLEPSCGSSNFIIGSKNNSFSFTGVEIEKHTYDIAKHLNPNADIRNGGFETFRAKDSFDLVVGNPPYIADFYVNDTNSLGNNLKIANYFPIKSMENLRDGGIMAFVMPSAFLDHNGDKHLERLVEAGGKFLGAVRLPNNAFKGAEVNTDIVFFQKQDLLINKDDKAINAELEAQGFCANFDMRRLSPEIREQLENKFKSVEDKLTIEEREQLDERERENKFYRRFKINDYFLNNPQNILGKFEIDTNRFGENVPVFKADENLDLKAELNRFIENLPKNIYKDIERETSPYRQFDFITHPESKPYIDNLKKGSFFIDNTNNGALALKIDSYEYRIISDTEFWKNSLVASQLSKYKAGNYDDNKRQKEEKALKAQVLSYIELRDSLNTLLRAELDPNKSDEEIAKFRQDLNTSYDKMKLKYKKPLKEAFKACDMDLSFEFISNLENEKGEKALIFSQRISSPIVEPKVSNEKEALIASLSMKGKIDLDYIKDIYPNQSLDDTLNKLLEEKLIFKNHEPYSKEKFVTSDAYLSGNVKKKYNEVLEVIKKTGDKSLEINASSLKEVFPADRNIKEISFGLGMNWIPTHIYQEFIDAYASEYRFEGIERRGSDVADKVFEITLSSNGEYIIENNANTYTKNLVKNNAYYMAMLSSEKEREGKSRSTYGLNFGNGRDFFSYDEFKKHMGWSNEELNNAKRIPLVYAALPLALNRQKARIERSLGYIRDDETGEILKYKNGAPRIKKEFHKELSDDLNAMITQIQDKFLRFVLSNEDLRKEVEQAYNDKINTDRVRDFNTQTLDLKGANPNIKLYPHQNAGVWRGVQEQATLFNVNVGGGKTFMGAAVALEQKRMGLINKTLIVSPKTLVGSWEKEIKTLYPNANILALDEKSFTKDNRAKFLAKIQINDYDAVIMSAEQFKLIPKNPEKTIANLALRLSMVKSDYDESKKDKKNTQLKKQIGKLEKQIQKARATADTIKKDNLVTFNELGIDCLIVDEAHLYKNLSYETQKTRVLGLGPQNGSDKAFDMKIVTDDFNDSGKKLYFLTGTPIANSMCELYHMQSFLQPKWLEDKGFYNFDNWANTFGEDVTDIEMGAGGEPKLVTRFARFNNLKELSGGFREVNFYANNEDIEKAAGQNFIPKVETIKEVIPRNEAISELYGEPDENGEFPKGSLLYRFGHFQENIKENNPLRLTNIARKAAVDYRLIEDKPENDFEVSKINKVVENVVDNYKNNHADEKGTQIIFLDLSVAKQKLKNISLDEDKKLKEENKTQGIESVSAEIKKSSRSNETLEPVFDKNGEEIKDDFRITYLSGEVEVFEAAEYVRELKALGIKLPKDLGNLRDLEEIEPNKFEMTGFSKIDIAAENDNKALKDVSFDAYSDIAKKLMKAGIPRDEITFIHDYPKKADKDKLFEQMRNGEVRVLLGSTSKMGVGMNVQKRLVALHNVDYTWNPAGMEQRVGRIARQGNMFFEADKSFQPKVYNYATERTYDVKALQLLETKQKGIYMLQNADRLGLNSFEDISTAAMEFAEMKAIASGNPLMIEEFKIGNMLEKEERAFAFWESDKIVTENNLRNKTEKMIQNTKDIKTFGKMIETTNDYKSEVESKYKHLTKPIIVKIDRYQKFSWSEKNSPKEIGEVKKEVNDMLEGSKLYISRVMNIGSNRSVELFADYKGVSVGVKLNTGKNSLGEPMHSLAICPSDNFDSNSAVALPKAKFRQEFFLSKDFNINYIMKKVDDELEKLPLLLDEAKAKVKTLEKEVEFGKNALNEMKEQGYPNQKLLSALRSDKKEILKHLKNKNNDWIPSYKKCLNSSSIENEKNTESKER
ncbi:MAG: SNF2-related protein [Campylobacter sp.]|uniref:SNF2-related protein n=1 Tax=Campylobacter sp. TaxID=205 RepID=UPI00297B35B8|nr:SNF2-related protein [Campylobacter sp.]MDD7599188.1 SNF2-related protein [Campylobacteraceae bacterium]MDY5887924.1 SNF2-related protein [Campylobacter sp.]